MSSVSISNIKEDETIVESKNKSDASNNESLTIERIGRAIKDNPGYVEYYKCQVIHEVMAKNPNATIIIDAGSGKANYTLPKIGK